MCIDTVGELFDALESLDLDPDAPVKLALQPNYPMSGSLRNICLQHLGDEGDVLWLACSDNENYGVPRDVWDESELYDDADDSDDTDEED